MRKLFRVSPWLLALQAGVALRENYQRLLTERDQTRLRTLLRKSKGRPGKNLTPRERTELKRLVKQMRLLSVGRAALPVPMGRRRSSLLRRRRSA